jgi:hypothetical protein
VKKENNVSTPKNLGILGANAVKTSKILKGKSEGTYILRISVRKETVGCQNCKWKNNV